MIYIVLNLAVHMGLGLVHRKLQEMNALQDTKSIVLPKNVQINVKLLIAKYVILMIMENVK